MCWQFWHTYRIEDLESDILMMNQSQIFNEEWQRKIVVSITDTGDMLEFDEAGSFRKRDSNLALCDYMITVEKSTRCILENLLLRCLNIDEFIFRQTHQYLNDLVITLEQI